MEQYKLFDPVYTPALNVVKSGWFNPVFTLTDGVHSYGRLFYKGIWRRTGWAETAQGCWEIKPGNIFDRNLVVTDSATRKTAALIKTALWTDKVTLETPAGNLWRFKKKGLLSGTYTWFSSTTGHILSVEASLFSFKQLFTLQFNPVGGKYNVDLLLLGLLGVHVILTRRAQAANQS